LRRAGAPCIGFPCQGDSFPERSGQPQRRCQAVCSPSVEGWLRTDHLPHQGRLFHDFHRAGFHQRLSVVSYRGDPAASQLETASSARAQRVHDFHDATDVAGVGLGTTVFARPRAHNSPQRKNQCRQHDAVQARCCAFKLRSVHHPTLELHDAAEWLSFNYLTNVSPDAAADGSPAINPPPDRTRAPRFGRGLLCPA
jgi:hypothetical protein